jgi:hypothetical protein
MKSNYVAHTLEHCRFYSASRLHGSIESDLSNR